MIFFFLFCEYQTQIIVETTLIPMFLLVERKCGWRFVQRESNISVPSDDTFFFPSSQQIHGCSASCLNF